MDGRSVAKAGNPRVKELGNAGPSRGVDQVVMVPRAERESNSKTLNEAMSIYQ